MPLNEFVECGQRLALINRMTVTSGKRLGSARLFITGQPVLKRADINAVESGNLRLSALMIQVGLDGSLASVCCCDSHAEMLTIYYGFSIVKCSNPKINDVPKLEKMKF